MASLTCLLRPTSACTSSKFVDSTSLLESRSLIGESCTKGSIRLKYRPHEEWDFFLENPFKPIDIELVLPNHRAHNQPTHHRLNALIAGNSEPIRVKCCRQLRRSKLYLEIQATKSDVTIWLPSDFKGRITHSATKASFSAGFVNHIMKNTQMNEIIQQDKFSECEEDEILVHTSGHILFRMWDVLTGAPEKPTKEAFKRMFGCNKKAPETTIDWDFLLDG